MREIESHLRERIAAVDGAPNERAALEKILGELGPPLRVAQAYSAERTIDEAVATGRVVPVVRAVWQLAASTFEGFFVALGLLVGYAAGLGFLAIAALKPIFPQNVGLLSRHGVPFALGAQFPVAPDTVVAGGYWIIPTALAIGLAILVGTHRGARRFLARWRERRALASEPVLIFVSLVLRGGLNPRPLLHDGGVRHFLEVTMIRSLLIAAAAAAILVAPGARPADHERRGRRRQELRAPRDDRRVRRRDEDRRDPRAEEDGLQGDLQLAALD